MGRPNLELLLMTTASPGFMVRRGPVFDGISRNVPMRLFNVMDECNVRSREKDPDPTSGSVGLPRKERT